MIAYPPQKRPSIREQFSAWLEHMKTVPDRMKESVESLVCPHCGEALTVRWARNSERWQTYHPLTRLWCEWSGASWWGDTREEAIENFRAEGTLVNGSLGNRENVLSGVSPGAHDVKTRATAEPAIPSQTRDDGNAVPTPVGAATLQGWEFSAEGMSEEDVNALLQINSASHKE